MEYDGDIEYQPKNKIKIQEEPVWSLLHVFLMIS